MAEYIERKVALAAIRERCAPCGEGIEALKSVPAADVAPVRHGRWEECDYVEPCIHGFGTIRHANAGLKCTNCVNVFKKELLWKDNYCPYCGAKMDGENTMGSHYLTQVQREVERQLTETQRALLRIAREPRRFGGEGSG